MKSYKNDILEILPVIKNEDDEEEMEERREKSFEELFKDFYKKERGTLPEEEVVDTLLSILGGEN